MNLSTKPLNKTTQQTFTEADNAVVNRMSYTAWQIAYSALWNGMVFSASEKRKALISIRSFITSGVSAELRFEEFVQRVLLTRQYIENNPAKYLPVPSAWLHDANPNGFAGTAKWFAELEMKRMAKPLYRAVWREFGWAVFQLSGTSAARNFHSWRSYFAICNQRLLNLFLSTAGNQCFWLRGGE